MQATDIRNPGERNKLILAGVLGIVALLFLWWTFFGFGSSKQPSPRAAAQPTPSAVTRATTNRSTPQGVEPPPTDLNDLRPVRFDPVAVSAPEASRNIFVYYEPPPPVQKASIIPTPTPTPIPPVLLASISPANVYARTADFTLEVSGDKFTPQLRVVIDNSQELPTRYINPQQVSATVPAALIANPGSRQVMLRSSDGKLYSNTTAISVAAPPTPNYSYIGIIGTPKYVDTAIVQDKANKEVLNVQRGDLLGGRFRVTSISEKEVVLVDNNLKIKHALAMSTQGERGNPLQRPTPRVDSEDDEP
jgi:hypothetical protein